MTRATIPVCHITCLFQTLWEPRFPYTLCSWRSGRYPYVIPGMLVFQHSDVRRGSLESRHSDWDPRRYCRLTHEEDRSERGL